MPRFPIRLVKYLSLAGVASRRKSFQIIQSGAVKINGAKVLEPSMLINENDIVTINNKKLSLNDFVYIMLNKPIGYTCSNRDPHTDKLAINLIKLPGYRLFNVGRLDKNSEGLIIFTNDGDYANTVTHPTNNVLKTYEVTLKSAIDQKAMLTMQNGIYDDGEFLKPISVKHITGKKYCFILNEGKKREIRRLLKKIRAEIVRLRRVAIGKLKLDNLPTGKWRILTSLEIAKSVIGQ